MVRNNISRVKKLEQRKGKNKLECYWADQVPDSINLKDSNIIVISWIGQKLKQVHA